LDDDIAARVDALAAERGITRDAMVARLALMGAPELERMLRPGNDVEAPPSQRPTPEGEG
jgi:hypothetical protein